MHPDTASRGPQRQEASSMTVEPLPRPSRGRVRRTTATARFGSSRRESHDATDFYDRFVAPELSDDSTVVVPKKVDVIYKQDARDMRKVESNSVALVVTSPPYFAGKEYEQTLGQNGVPGTYFEYLDLLHGVFEECKRVLEPGGRLAVNVANLGRRPYRSLAGRRHRDPSRSGAALAGRGHLVEGQGRRWLMCLGDIPTTEQSRAAGRDRTDRDRQQGPVRPSPQATPATCRRACRQPERSRAMSFSEATTDLWEIPPESATRVGHPAPYPIELPKRLIELYTYEGDVVLGSVHGLGYDCGRGVAHQPALHRLRHRHGVRQPREDPDRRGEGTPRASDRSRDTVPGPVVRRSKHRRQEWIYRHSPYVRDDRPRTSHGFFWKAASSPISEQT